jgi:hypothetical protein
MTRVNKLNLQPRSQDRDNPMKDKLKQITNFNPQPSQYWRMRLKKKSIKKKHKKQPESIHQTHDPGHQIEIIL